MLRWDEDIDLNEVHNKLRNKVNFQKLLDSLDKACDLVEENFDGVKQHLEKQEDNFLSLSCLFFEKYKNKTYGDRIIFQDKPYLTCYYDKRKKIIKFDDGQTLAEKILSILKSM